jgi:signal transduction histidine kinase
VTDRLNAGDIKVLREIIRRAGHEIRNALNGVAVNVEVVRSRSTRHAAASEVTAFAERAIRNASAASVLTNGLLALTNASLGPGPVGPKAKKDHITSGSVELTLGDATAVLSDIRRLAAAIDVSVEERGANVILKVLPEGQSHSED